MKIRRLYGMGLVVAALGVAGHLMAQTPAPTASGVAPSAAHPVAGLDPNEIPLPEIKTSLGKMPGVSDLPERREMPDPLVMNDGTRVATPQQWAARREEMKRILEYYAVGQAPPAPGNVKATIVKTQSLAGGKFTYRLVHLTFGPGEKLALDIGVFTPMAPGKVGVVIAQSGTPPGATPLARLPNGPNQGRSQDVLVPPLPATMPAAALPRGRGPGGPPGGAGAGGDPERIAANNPVLAHGFAYVTFEPNDCAEDTTLRNLDGSFSFRSTRFPAAYPNYDWGVLRAWAWGVSRIVDYLETDPAIDATKIAVTGVSRNGKAALIAGAFDDRITLVAPVASSGGGTPAYRFSGAEHGGNEGLSEMVRKYPNWFSPHLHEFYGQAYKLPFDEHWFFALCAPRTVVALEGTQDPNVNKVGVKQSFLGAEPVFAFLHVPERIAVSWAERPHGMNQQDWDALLALADRDWLGKKVERRFDQFPAAADALPASMPASPAK